MTFNKEKYDNMSTQDINIDINHFIYELFQIFIRLNIVYSFKVQKLFNFIVKTILFKDFY